VCLRIYDNDESLLCLDIGYASDLFEYNFCQKTEYPAGVEFISNWDNKYTITKMQSN
jgi:hypothetical protein